MDKEKKRRPKKKKDSTKENNTLMATRGEVVGDGQKGEGD